MSYIYIASPYTHDDPEVRRLRYEKTRDFTAHLISKYHMHVFSPIVMTHDIAISHSLPYEVTFWKAWNIALLTPATGLLLFQIDGWDRSAGMRHEIDFAKNFGKPIINSLEAFSEFDHSIL